MGFFAYWHQSGLITLLCFDVPIEAQADIQSLSSQNTADSSSPYPVFLLVLDALLRLYDNSVWSIRNHTSRWEAVSLAPHTCF